MKVNEVFSKFDKKELVKNHQKWKPLSYITKDGMHLVIYFWKETSILGMKYKDNKPPRAFAAKLQPKQFFILDAKYFPLADLKYYDSETEIISFPSALYELKINKENGEHLEEHPIVKWHYADLESAPLVLRADERKLLKVSKADESTPDLNEIENTWSAAEHTPPPINKIW